MDAPVNWFNTLVVYGPLGVFAAVAGLVWFWKQVKGDPQAERMIKAMETSSSQIAVSNELHKQSADTMSRVASILEVANEGRKEMVSKLQDNSADIKVLTKSFDDLTAKISQQKLAA